jgi:esterase/lipase
MKGCLLIHGFTGSPKEIDPLADYLKETTDWLVHTPVLPGHGEDESLGDVTYTDWLWAADRELYKMSRHCDEIYVIGFSMGGMIAAYLASKYPISKLVLLSAAVYTLNSRLLMKDMKQILTDYFQEGRSLQESMAPYREKVTGTPLSAVINFRRLIKKITPLIEDIKVPVLIVQGEQDHLVQPKSAHFIYNQIQSDQKELLLLKESKHKICQGCEAEILFDRIEHFLNDLTLEAESEAQTKSEQGGIFRPEYDPEPPVIQ